MKRQKLRIKSESGAVSALLERPNTIIGAMTLAHGAGAGMHHVFLTELAAALAARGFAVLRFQFPFTEAGRRRVDAPAVAVATVKAAVRTLVVRVPGVPVFAAGKSFGARMTTTAAAGGRLAEVDGVICYGFPLHPAGRPGVTRAEHLADVPMKTLFLQGTRDGLADLKLMKKVCAKLPHATLKIVEGADHGFGVLKRSGRSPEEVFDELADASVAFANACRPRSRSIRERWHSGF